VEECARQSRDRGLRRHTLAVVVVVVDGSLARGVAVAVAGHAVWSVLLVKAIRIISCRRA
jgi:hypothetical protein